jgi:hypothetical protein
MYATYFVTQVFSRNILNFNIWAQKKRHPPARMPPKTNEKHKTLTRPKYRDYSLFRRFVRPNTTALIIRFKISTTLSSFVLSVNAVIVPAAVRMAKQISAQYVKNIFVMLQI